MKLAGRIITWVGGLLLVVACFLHFSAGVSLWGGGARDALLLTVLAAAGVTLSIVSIFADFSVLVAAQVALGVYAFGEAFTLGGVGNFSGLQVGFWLASIASAGMVVGGSLLAAAIWGRHGWKRTTGLMGPGWRSAPAAVPGAVSATPANGNGSSVTPPNGNTGPAAGWYRDPSGQGAFRYWSGQTWTDQVRA